MSEIKLPEPNLSGYRLDATEWAVGYTADQMKAAILEERERCAKIAEEMRPTGGRAWDEKQNACFSALGDCASAIRSQ